ncbi:DEAD/DEAH box helicase [Maritimibacter sp. UBA3975]|uniref:DEAD/DEAH box helicase n=1 Tax=Maritimibacter sp. UBA3975 TaxID=1946833 RepID=UPI000C0BB32E|nr:DEAD/DEAH box helicase [Maritimibacter sp. UBA3975]MAM63555.1 ATP-dependent RNA helicase [Maritimibacter sp.]|tara:strand:+ start:52069 stop:54123 length:2055 start_codon:yes stop_codon:yes gene_type:complete
MTRLISEALAERGYDTLTPVQEAVSDPDLVARDLLVSAQTGSGKTVGFGLAIAPTLLEEAESFGPAGLPLALVVAPTRELAMQVMRELGWLYAKTGARVTSCVGGMDMRDERRALERGAHIVVGTPGRLRDHIQRGSLDMNALRAIVLDEADEMLDLGFREDLEFMLEEAPAERRILLFSATVPPAIAKLAKQYQRDAARINTVTGSTQHTDIAYQAIRVAQTDGEHAIFNLLRYHDSENAIVFANTRAAVAHLTARLSNRGLAVVSLSGELSQNERTHALQAMRDGRAQVCVATDVAARGIDLPNLDLVIHADLPKNTESLLHRSGRTGRAGRKGISALIVPPRDTKRTERLLGWAKIDAEWRTAPSADDILARDEERLLSDPVWSEPVSDAGRAFAEKLLAQYDAETVAAAYLRLFQSRQGAPEDLLPPDTKPERKERKAFGPSRWFALSIGQKDKAEARWLLPLLLRTGGMDKADIGAIRVQNDETFVEITEKSASGFLAALGADGELDEGIKARALDGAPELGPRPRPERSNAPRPHDRPQRDKRDAKPREDRPDRAPKPREHDGAKRKFADKRKAQEETGATAPYKPRTKPAPKGDKPGPKGDKPRWEGKKDGAKSAKPRADKKPAAAPASKPRPAGKPGAADASKSFRKPGAKPTGPRKGKPAQSKGGNAKPRRKPGD